jgi:acetylglutamate kinase
VYTLYWLITHIFKNHEKNSMHSKNNKPNSQTSGRTDDIDLQKKIIIKFGGNAMKSISIQDNVADNICELNDNGFEVVVIHGGGPEINKILTLAGIESEFVGGHRKTDETSISYIEMALRGNVNGELVRIINSKGKRAVGLSGKDGRSVTAKKRFHKENINGKTEYHDLGLVGDVDVVNTDLIDLMLKNNYLPVIAPIAFGDDNKNYNINADMFAGSIAGALSADHFVVLTDVDGLLKDKDDPATLIENLSLEEVNKYIGNIISGGMIPKIESCVNAINSGVKNAHIINGTVKDILKKKFLNKEIHGTIIKS